jgi:hypothetical protein
MEDGVLVTVTLFTSAESTEVFSSLGNNIVEKLEDNTLWKKPKLVSAKEQNAFKGHSLTPRGWPLAETSKKT